MSENRNSFIEATKPTDEKLEALKQLYPGLFSDGKINLDVLKEITGGENPQEDRTPGYYGLYWPGKRKAKIEAKASPKGTLVPVPGDGVNEDSTHNIYIEGDNLEVLRILKQSYKGRVKMIYIDPPYNTGNDFIYPDDYTMPVEEYKRLTVQTDEKGNALTTNQKSNGAFHTNWLNMMLPRLMLARELLTEDGVIFISIDDNEQANLKLLCDDVFGEENYLGNFPRVTKKSGKTTDAIAKNHDYVLVYSKNENPSLYLPQHTDDAFKYEDEYVNERGKYKLNQTLDYDSLSYSSSLDYPIEIDGLTLYPGNDYEKYKERKAGNHARADWAWRWSKDLYDFGLANGFIVLKKYKDYARIYTKTYQNAKIVKDNGSYKIEILDRTKTISTLEFVENEYSNDNSKKDLSSLFGANIFDYSKPVSLMESLIKYSTNENDIVLDFFSGSATTGNALLNINKDKKHRKFILVQLPQDCLENPDALKSGFQNICEIGKERIRRAGAKILEEAKANKDMFSKDNPLDIGFKVYRMQESNFKEYTPVQGQDENAAKSLFEELENNQIPLVDGWKSENVLTEIILKQGFALDCDCKKVDAFTKNTVYCIKDSKGPASRTTTMYVCLDSQIDSDTIKNLKLDEKEKFVCLNSAIDDTSYARLADKGRIETI